MGQREVLTVHAFSRPLMYRRLVKARINDCHRRIKRYKNKTQQVHDKIKQRYRFGYVDDTFTAVRHDEIDAFYHHLNEQNTDIQFTWEVEENGKLPFLDCLISRDDKSLRITVYRKPTHTDRLLDDSSYSPTSNKATTIRTLTSTRTSTLTVFFLRTTTTKTSSNVTLTDLLLLLLPKLATTQLLRKFQLTVNGFLL